MYTEMRGKYLFTLVIIWTLLQFSTRGFAQPAVESFESVEILKHFDIGGGTKISTSSRRYKFGESSLEWEWQGNSDISTNYFRVLTLEESPLVYGDHFPASPTLSMSIYNEDPQEAQMRIAFGQDGAAEVWFDMTLDFSGWRTIWVPFFEMNGNTPDKGKQVKYNFFKMSIDAPLGGGKIYLDDIVYAQYQDDRFPYPDLVVPFIKKDLKPGADHWLPVIENFNKIDDLKLPGNLNDVLADLNKVEARVDAYAAVASKYKVYIDKLSDDFEALNIKEVDGVIVGPPLTYAQAEFYYDEAQQGELQHNEIKTFGIKMKNIAALYSRATPEEQKKMAAMFILGTKYYLDQGWQKGASGGTRHHIGYFTRNLALGFFFMRHVLEKEGLLNEVGASLHWLFNLGSLLGSEDTFHANIDYFNTQVFYHLMLIFLTDDQSKQAALLEAFSDYLSIVLAKDGHDGTFKVDGTGWHHNGHYPAYALGAYRNLPKVIQTLSGTMYAIGAEGHSNFRKAFMATRLYSHTYDIGFGNAGRHPLGQSIENLREPYLQMTNAGMPGSNGGGIDKGMAAAYLRLWGDQDPVSTQVFGMLNGVEKENISGYYSFPYAATAVQRQDDWIAIIKGYSKYVWASEIYVTDNRYGRYPANGTIQLYNAAGNAGSGFNYEGWDWNRYPGGTVIYLPFEELEPDAPLLMYRSSETFAGSVTQGNSGVFGMVLNESKGSNADGEMDQVGFPGKLRAKKSVFSFQDKLICIGTNISSIDAKNPTQTNLFQTALLDKKDPIYSSEKKLGSFPSTYSLMIPNDSWLVDPYGNGYHILSADKVSLGKQTQKSFHNKYSIRTGKISDLAKGVKETEGNFASAWLDHGTAPEDASYQYVIYPGLNKEEIKRFSTNLKKDESYDVLQADDQAHIVRDVPSSTTGYVVFDSDAAIKHGPLQSVSDPALVMLKEKENKLHVSIVQPDLNFEPDGWRYKNTSRPVELIVTIAGIWRLADGNDVLDMQVSENQTQIKITLIHGLSNHIHLVH